jgi:hypothetical protein
VRLIPEELTGLSSEKTAIKALFNHRLSGDPSLARVEWLDIVEARHSLWIHISSEKRELVRLPFPPLPYWSPFYLPKTTSYIPTTNSLPDPLLSQHHQPRDRKTSTALQRLQLPISLRRELIPHGRASLHRLLRIRHLFALIHDLRPVQRRRHPRHQQ